MINAIRNKLFDILRSFLGRKGFALVKWKNQDRVVSLDVPADATAYLVNDNPRLQQMVNDYKTLSEEITNSIVWNWNSGGMGSNPFQMFRGDRAYVWQLKGVDIPEMRYLTSTYYQLDNDKMGLLDRFKDDNLFGNILFKIGQRTISREILDSANEINFLESHLKLSEKKDLKVLDIGAGYGRLAHRFSDAYDNLGKYYCTDGVPVSAFICEYYLRFRSVGKAEVVEMPFIAKKLIGERIDVALNIHSFSECSLESIDWWIRQISDLNIPHLMVVPNAYEETGAKLLTNKRQDFSSIIKKHNYELIAREPKYSEPLMQQLGLYPTYYFLFRKTNST